MPKHGMCRTPEYKSWEGAKNRCFNPNGQAADRYINRGITMCEEWSRDFLAFYRDMGPKPTPAHSLERVDNNLGYAPSNCRWATAQEQQSNRISTVLMPWGMGLVTLTEFARLTGIPNQTLSRWRINLPMEVVLERCRLRILGAT